MKLPNEVISLRTFKYVFDPIFAKTVFANIAHACSVNRVHNYREQPIDNDSAKYQSLAKQTIQRDTLETITNATLLATINKIGENQVSFPRETGQLRNVSTLTPSALCQLLLEIRKSR